MANSKPKNGLTATQISDKVKILKIGETFEVTTDSERRHALNAARYQGKKISTSRNSNGKFTVLAV